MLQIIIVILFFISNVCALYSTDSNVIELTDENFDKLVTNSDAVWIVEFFAPWCGHCQQFVPEYQKAAKALKGIIKVGAVNANQHDTLAFRFNVRGYPSIKIFNADKSKPKDYDGQRTARELINAVLAAAREKIRGILDNKTENSKDVIELTDENFNRLVLESNETWLVEFYAPWCGHCKNLEPHWAEAATNLKGKVKLGAMDATANTIKASEYDLKGYPTIKYFPPDKKDLKSIVNYEGGRTAQHITTWAVEKLMENMPAREIVQILNEASFQELCDNSSLCVIAFLPHILDCQANCRNQYLNTLKDMSVKFKKYAWGWIWSEAGAQSAFENAFDIGGFGYPAMAVVNVKKMKYSILRGSFSCNGINEFLRDISFGRGTTAAVQGVKRPEIVNIEPWDGKDRVLLMEDDSEVQLESDASDESVPDKDEL